MKQNIVKRLDDRQHILMRPSMYIGGMSEISEERLMILDNQLQFETIEYVPGLWKIIDEIFANSVDEFIRTNGKFADKITVTFNADQIIVIDNGRGFPQAKLEDGVPMGVAAVTEAKSGTNFDEETKADASIGTNGVGSFATNVFSKEFIMDTYDGKNGLHLVCKDNCEQIDWNIKKSSAECGTTVKFKPDLQRFGVTSISDVYPLMMSNVMMHLSQVFDIKFTLVNNIKSTRLEDLF